MGQMPRSVTEGTSPAHIRAADFHPPEPWEDARLVVKPSTLGHSATAAPGVSQTQCPATAPRRAPLPLPPPLTSDLCGDA